MIIDLIIPPLLVGLLLALAGGPLGSFVVWGRMSYLGDTLAHASLLGVSLGLLANLSPLAGVMIMTLLVAIVLGFSQRQNVLSNDTLLGIIAHGSLALGLVIAHKLDTVNIDIMGFLFGDLLAVNYTDVLWVGAITLLVLGLVGHYWNALLNSLISAELAQAEGINVERMRMLTLILLALLVAVGMKAVGALLMTALLIIPAATARRLANTPEQMALLASVLGLLAIMSGLFSSFYWDTPTGPSIVLCACVIFLLALFKPTNLFKPKPTN